MTVTPVQRGTTNGNARGGSQNRRRRREWLVSTYRANVDVLVMDLPSGPLTVGVIPGTENAVPACRCYRCGLLLTTDTVTVDRIIPGALGGTYRRSNIRPSCQPCASYTGAVLGNERKKNRS